MFNRPIALVLVCCSTLLSGCTHTPIISEHISTTQLIESHFYQKAIEQIITEKPIDQVLLRKVKELTEAHRKKQMNKVGILVKQKKWGEARNTLKNLNANQPSQASFAAVNLQIDKAQFEEERIINTQRALLEAELLSVQFIQQDLSHRIHQDSSVCLVRTKHLMHQKQQLAEKLLHLSTQALLVKDYDNAQKAYEKAIKLNRELSTGEIIKAINSGLSQKNNNAINQRSNSLIRQLYSAIAKQDFDALLKIQAILSNEPFHGTKVERALRKAKKTRSEHSFKLDNMASKQYRAGDISQAVVQWQQALRLTPDDINIQEKLIRAQKVQRKLKKLTVTKEPSQP